MSIENTEKMSNNRHSAAIITVSDSASSGKRGDESGPALCDFLECHGYSVIYTAIVPDDMNEIVNELIKCSDSVNADLILTAGGTGFTRRDITPEATECVIERNAPGISEYMRMVSMQITPRAILSRGVSGIRGSSLIINLPGSKKACIENISSVIEALPHGLDLLKTDGSNSCAG